MKCHLSYVGLGFFFFKLFYKLDSLSFTWSKKKKKKKGKLVVFETLFLKPWTSSKQKRRGKKKINQCVVNLSKWNCLVSSRLRWEKKNVPRKDFLFCFVFFLFSLASPWLHFVEDNVQKYVTKHREKKRVLCSDTVRSDGEGGREEKKKSPWVVERLRDSHAIICSLHVSRFLRSWLCTCYIRGKNELRWFFFYFEK